MMKISATLLLLSVMVLGVSAQEAVDAPQTAWQGKTLVVKIASSDGPFDSAQGKLRAAGCELFGKKYKLYEDGDGFKGIIGVLPEQKAGKYQLVFNLEYQDGATEKVIKPLTVKATKFPSTSYWLKPARKKLLDDKKKIADEWAKVEAALRKEFEKQSWKERFILPVGGEISMSFGHRQVINGKKAGPHRGVDFAVESGTQVKAPNDGQVVFAGQTASFGNTVVIDHGQGIHTLYFHLSKFLASVGQKLTKGDVFALSGNTGISSGAHLHWAMSVHNVRVDPLQWTRQEI